MKKVAKKKRKQSLRERLFKPINFDFKLEKPRPMSDLTKMVESFTYLAHHQDFRAGMLQLADQIHSEADALRSIGQGLNRLADIFEKVRWNDPKAAK